LWHHRLGHPTAAVVQQVVHRHQLPVAKESNNKYVCDACQQGKSHQLPYLRSSTISDSAFDLVFSDVWGPTPTSIGHNNYYVSFIDDHTKFVWIYLLQKKLKFSNASKIFKLLLKGSLTKKIRSIQTNWGGEYQALSPFFKRVGITHRVSCPHAHQQNGAAL
jgi:histone deacetylase 1/2